MMTMGGSVVRAARWLIALLALAGAPALSQGADPSTAQPVVAARPATVPAASTADLLRQAQQIASAPLTDYSLAEMHRLVELRQRLVHARDRAHARADAGTLDTRILQAQIAAFGPPPAAGASEPMAITTQRQALDQLLATRIGPVLAAKETQAAAATLVREIDGRLSRMRHHRLFSYNASPLDPRTWTTAIATISDTIALGGRTYAAAWVGPNRSDVRDQAIAALVIASLGSVLGALLLRWLIRIIDRRIAAATSAPRRLLLNLLRDIVGAVLLTIAIVAAWLAIALVLQPVMPEAIWIELMRTLIASSLVVMVAGWLGQSILLSPFPELRIVRLNDDDALRGRRIILLLGVVVALEAVFSLIEDRAWVGVAFADLVSATIVLGGGWLLLRLTLILRRRDVSSTSAQPIMDVAGASDADRLDFVGPISRLTRLVVFVSVVAALLGFVILARSALVATIVSLGLIAIAVYLQNSIQLIVTMLGQSALHRYHGVLHFLPMLSGLILTLLAIPLLAVVWGYQSSELVDGLVALRRGVAIGDVKVSAGDVLTFGLVFLVGYIATRWVQRILKTSILPQFALDIGARAAIVTIIGYSGIVLAAVIAIATTGMNLSSLAFVFGALSVGLGFGLQSVVENFTSGVILLLERPVREGDWIEVGDKSGIVRKISVRSTRLETWDQHYIIIPNSQLITGAVKNLSLGSTAGRIAVPISVAYGTDLDRVRALLIDVARGHKLVLAKPKPVVAFDAFGDSAIDLKLLCFVANVTTGAGVQSDLRFAIARRFGEQGIEIPYPQREVRFHAAPTGPAEDASPPPA